MSESSDKSSSTRLLSRRDGDSDAERSRRLGVPRGSRPGHSTASHRMIEGIKTFLWVAPLTVLIWIYAERAQRSEVDVPVTLAVRSASADRIVSFAPAETRRVELTLSGPRASLDAARDLMMMPQPLDLVVPDQYVSGQEVPISVVDLIGKHDLFVRAGVTVDRARPPTVRVSVQDRDTIEVPVKMQPDAPAKLDPKFDPPMVTVSGPKQMLDKLRAEGAVYANLASYASYPTGTHTIEQVPLLPPNGATEAVTITPAKVKATITIQQSQPQNIPAVPISVVMRAVLMDQWQAKVPVPTVQNVRVIGPAEQLQKIISKEFQPEIFVVLFPPFTEGDRQIVLKAEDYKMPPGVTVENPAQTVTVRLSSQR